QRLYCHDASSALNSELHLALALVSASDVGPAASALTGAITAAMTGEACRQSALLAEKMGSFKGFTDARCSGVTAPVAKDNIESMLGVIALHRDAVRSSSASERFQYLHHAARQCLEEALEF